MQGTGGDSEWIASGEARDEFWKVFEDRFFVAHDLEEAIFLLVAEMFDGESGFVAGDEIFDEGFVGAANVIIEIDAMRFGVAHFSEKFEVGAFVERFAVDDDTVHVEDDGLILLHSKSRSGNWKLEPRHLGCHN